MRRAEWSDMAGLKPLLRDPDRSELEALGDVERTLRYSWDQSPVRVASVAGNDLVAVFGVAGSVIHRRGIPWCLTTRAANGRRIEFARKSRAIFDGLRLAYDQLENRVDARYTSSINWLRWLGFIVEPAMPFGVNGEPFHRFWWSK